MTRISAAPLSKRSEKPALAGKLPIKWSFVCLETPSCLPAGARWLVVCMQGRNVVLESKYGSPKIVNDGVTVAKEVELEDPVENIGAKLVRQVCLSLLVCSSQSQGPASA